MKKLYLFLPLWGEKYRKFFHALVWPSLCAPGNLPALCKEFPVQLVFLTKKENYEQLSKDVLGTSGYPHGRLTTAAVFIDDLCEGRNIGVILTLAYARGIFAKQAEVSDPIFVFLNNDFILSENTLEHLAGLLKKGKKAVMMPSLRVNLEDVRESLLNKKDQRKNILQIPGREMVKLGLSHLHTTTLAKEVTNQLFHSTHPNQLIWRIDDQTFLARFFLIFMFALVPNRKLEAINSFCDYALMDDLCLGEPLHVIADSDDACLFELQPRIADTYLIRWGPFDHKRLAGSLSSWINPRHVEASKTDIIYHAAEVSPKTEKVKKQAATFMKPLYETLKPQNYKNHPHWKEGVYDYLSKSTKTVLDSKEILNISSNCFSKLKIAVKIKIAQLFLKDIRYEFSGEEPFCDSRTMALVKKIKENYTKEKVLIIADQEIAAQIYYSFKIIKEIDLKFFFLNPVTKKIPEICARFEKIVFITKKKSNLKIAFSASPKINQIFCLNDSKNLEDWNSLVFYFSQNNKIGKCNARLLSYINKPLNYYNQIVDSKKHWMGDYREVLNKIFISTILDKNPVIPWFLRKAFPFLPLLPENNLHEKLLFSDIHPLCLQYLQEDLPPSRKPFLGWSKSLRLQKLLFRIISENMVSKKWQRKGFVEGFNPNSQIICFEAEK